ncbi:hypothetical protein SO802_033059 [Lithocarpus litseifolius]|uniref:Uncharacterized protein n=1 Tax=Lithocarpus litseifolius TaxID=425828 RepID=A0AAW2BEX1_9ROSI
MSVSAPTVATMAPFGVAMSPAKAVDLSVSDKLAVITIDPFMDLPSAIHVKSIATDPEDHGPIERKSPNQFNIFNQAKNLIGANLNGTSNPYAIITCGIEKRFSSMVPGSRNPM